jgi:hypothetical protein
LQGRSRNNDITIPIADIRKRLTLQLIAQSTSLSLSSSVITKALILPRQACPRSPQTGRHLRSPCCQFFDPTGVLRFVQSLPFLALTRN